MRKIIYIAILITAIFGLSSCSDKSQKNFNNDMDSLFNFD
ncbi:hypothetical protein LNTAR_05156 [Lentisphaera araneosa HTCC2155]|uniref:Uncharacterized protein n=1 Tax=Lentisphaera araneosa HTCC2155 TaxID=313628 RepID=A6DLL8_9BACT|nr:hypothetical protein LNTAR_05156 [Lentisphaera araneosa HTCC2155]